MQSLLAQFSLKTPGAVQSGYAYDCLQMSPHSALQRPGLHVQAAVSAAFSEGSSRIPGWMCLRLPADKCGFILWRPDSPVKAVMGAVLRED
eukprot:1140267-Pelagomonas_calceolata.AAC.10